MRRYCGGMTSARELKYWPTLTQKPESRMMFLQSIAALRSCTMSHMVSSCSCSSSSLRPSDARSDLSLRWASLMSTNSRVASQ